MSKFYSNGKLLLTGEYVVLDGAISLALPTKFGQDLQVKSIPENQLVWESYSVDKQCWFSAVFSLPKLRLINATFNSKEEGSSDFIAETLQNILQEAAVLNPNFLNNESGFLVQTKLTFPRDWGLGSSSTLINNIASWAKVDAFDLLKKSFSGSGYDIACAQHNSPILYQVNTNKPKVTEVSFNPSFAENLFFIHLNKKQNSREGIRRYKDNRKNSSQAIDKISEISSAILKADSLLEFENLVKEHEEIISNIVQLPTVKQELFSDYFGEIKSLGAWGGDFILATGNKKTPQYFKEKGYSTIFSYTSLIL